MANNPTINNQNNTTKPAKKIPAPTLAKNMLAIRKASPAIIANIMLIRLKKVLKWFISVSVEEVLDVVERAAFDFGVDFAYVNTDYAEGNQYHSSYEPYAEY